MTAIHSLSELMVRQSSDQPVVSGLFGEVGARQFRHDVAALTAVLCKKSCKRWALCLQDSYYFSVAFLATAHAGCELVLPGNLQPDALKEIGAGFSIGESGVCQASRRFEERIHGDKGLEKKIKKIENKLYLSMVKT